MAAKFSEKAKRSLAKTITYRILIVISDGVIVYAITHKYEIALTVIIVRNISAMAIYYFHERFWNDVHWGKSRK